MINIRLFMQGSVMFMVQSHTDLGLVPAIPLTGCVTLGK